MKALSIIKGMILSAAMTFQIAQGQESPVLEQLHGTWHLAQRICSSGAPAHDDFDPRFDRVVMRVDSSARQTDAEFEHYTRFRNCDYWVRGNVRPNGQVLFFFNITGASNCQGFQLRDRDSMIYRLDNDQLSLFKGPMDRPGLVCPQGDLIEFVYRR